MENFKFERKTDLPILWIKVPFGDQIKQHGHITLQYVNNVTKFIRAIKDKFTGRFELIVTPSDFEIEIERTQPIVINIDSNTDMEKLFKQLDELGGNVDDQSGNGTPVDGCQRRTGQDNLSI